MKRFRLIGPLVVVILILSACSKTETASTSSVIRVAVSPTIPPMLFEENRKYAGIDLDIFTGFCESRGCTLKITAYDWLGMLGAVSSGQADVAFSGISITDKRKEAMDFSEPYYVSSWRLISLSKRNIKITDLAQLKQYSIGYPTGAVFDGYVRSELQPKGYYAVHQIKHYPSYSEALIALQNGTLDLVFVDNVMLVNYQKTLKMPVVSSYEVQGFDKLGFAFTRGSKIRADFDKYLAELGPDGLKEIVSRWIQ